jgi:hypothetical protein
MILLQQVVNPAVAGVKGGIFFEKPSIGKSGKGK